MHKSKEQRRLEAVERQRNTLSKRSARLLVKVRDHHVDPTNKWTYDRLREEVKGFHALLRDLGMNWGNESFFVFRNSIMTTEHGLRLLALAGSPQRQCVYCLAQFGKQHVDLCVGGNVEAYDAIYKDINV